MRFADLIGHARSVARLRRAVAEGRVPSAVLLVGPAGIGKRALADAFAGLLLCGASAGEDACGACPDCTRVAADTHPDLRVVAREEDRRDIRIEQVRELARWLSLRALVAPRKVAVIDEAHTLNEHGQNALLKTLEEPPGAAVLVLVATSVARLLPTVRSRCQVLRLEPLPPEEVARVLVHGGMAAERARLLAPLAEGCPGRVLALEAEDATRARTRLLDVLPRLDGLTAAELSQLAQELSRGPLDAALSTTVGWYRDVLETALAGGAARLRNADAAAGVAAAAARLAPAARLRQLEAVCDTLDALGRNANRMLAVETMLLALRAIERGTPTTSWTSRP